MFFAEKIEIRLMASDGSARLNHSARAVFILINWLSVFFKINMVGNGIHHRRDQAFFLKQRGLGVFSAHNIQPQNNNQNKLHQNKMMVMKRIFLYKTSESPLNVEFTHTIDKANYNCQQRICSMLIILCFDTRKKSCLSKIS